MTAELGTTAGSDVKGARLGRPVNSPGGDEFGLVDTADQLPAMISWWDGEERNRFANRSALQWFGLSPSQVYGMHLQSLLGPSAYAMNLAGIEAALGGDVQQSDRILRDGEGRSRRVQTSYTPRWVHGALDGFYLLMVDITPRVRSGSAARESTDAVLRIRARDRSAGRLDVQVMRGLTATSLELSASLRPGAGNPARIRPVLVVIQQLRWDLRAGLRNGSPRRA
jgi:PAS domain S-box-containing protein